MNTEIKTAVNWTGKINDHENVVFTTNEYSGLKHLKATFHLTDEDKEYLKDIDSKFNFGGKEYQFEMIEDIKNRKIIKGIAIYPPLDLNSNQFKEAEQLVLSFLRYDEE